MGKGSLQRFLTGTKKRSGTRIRKRPRRKQRPPIRPGTTRKKDEKNEEPEANLPRENIEEYRNEENERNNTKVFTIVDIDKLSQELTSALVCRLCHGDITLTVIKEEDGMSSHFDICCPTCNSTNEFCDINIVKTEQQFETDCDIDIVKTELQFETDD